MQFIPIYHPSPLHQFHPHTNGGLTKGKQRLLVCWHRYPLFRKSGSMHRRLVSDRSPSQSGDIAQADAEEPDAKSLSA
jgi:hypothetical protein